MLHTGGLFGMTKLSIIMPVFNEGATVLTAVKRVLFVDYPCPVELIVVDDGSVDSTAERLEGLAGPGVQVVRHQQNQGKGAAVRTGVDLASGTHMSRRRPQVVGVLLRRAGPAGRLRRGRLQLARREPHPGTLAQR